MADVTLSYKGSDILELSDSGSATLKTGGKYCEDDIAVEYVKPSGGSSISPQDVFDRAFPTGDFVLELGAFGSAELANQDGVFRGNTHLENITFSAKQGVTTPTTPDRGFYLSSVKKISQLTDLPIIHIGAQSFYSAKSLEIVALQNSGKVFTSSFERCSNLTVVELGQAELFRNYIFRDCTKLETLILRGTSVCSLSSTTSFDNTPFASGKTGGTLYVPQALISDYQDATNWSTILGYANNQILPIEGSQYETHHADGTVIS